MKKLYISADIEGTCGIVNWDETEKGHADHAFFAAQMTREVCAACEGAHEAGFDEVLVKDAHDSARNLDPAALPEYAHMLRGWTGHPYCMMAGLDGTFSGVVFTGYHSGVGMPGNPLSHTMDTSVSAFTLNGEPMSELALNCLIAAYENVPVLCVSGDSALCDAARALIPAVLTVPVNQGIGGGVLAMHPAEATRRIREAVARAAALDSALLVPKMPAHFHVEISYKEHARAFRKAFFPGARLADARTIAFDADDYMDVLRFMMFVL